MRLEIYQGASEIMKKITLLMYGDEGMFSSHYIYS